jgi:hypothetical protein
MKRSITRLAVVVASAAAVLTVTQGSAAAASDGRSYVSGYFAVNDPAPSAGTVLSVDVSVGNGSGGARVVVFGPPPPPVPGGGST